MLREEIIWGSLPIKFCISYCVLSLDMKRWFGEWRSYEEIAFLFGYSRVIKSSFYSSSRYSVSSFEHCFVNRVCIFSVLFSSIQLDTAYLPVKLRCFFFPANFFDSRNPPELLAFFLLPSDFAVGSSLGKPVPLDIMSNSCDSRECC